MLIVGYNGNEVAFENEGTLEDFKNAVATWHVENDEHFGGYTSIGMHDDDGFLWELPAPHVRRINNTIECIVIEETAQANYEQQERDYLMTYPGRL